MDRGMDRGMDCHCRQLEHMCAEACKDHDLELLTWSGMEMSNVRTPWKGAGQTALPKLREHQQQLQARCHLPRK